jgi:hypothetical protein
MHIVMRLLEAVSGRVAAMRRYVRDAMIIVPRQRTHERI